VSHLLPDGIGSLRDAPYPLFRAIRAALTFLSFEELPEDDIPPRSIWLRGEDLEEWFKEVKRRHKDKLGGRQEIDDPVRNGAIDLLVH
jgi:hypothetical protein